MNYDWSRPQPGKVHDFCGGQVEKEITKSLENALLSGSEWPKAWAYMAEGAALWKKYESCSYQTTEEHGYLSKIAPQLASLVHVGATIVDNGSADCSKTQPFISALEGLGVSCSFHAFEIARDAVQHAINRQEKPLEYVELSGGWGTFEDGKRFLGSVPTQRVLISIGSTFSNSSGQFEEAVVSSRSLFRNENDFMIIGLDCHTDKDYPKVRALYENPKFGNVMDSAVKRAGRTLGIPGPWTDRWEYKEEWRVTSTYICHIHVVTAKTDIEWKHGHIMKGAKYDFFPSYKFHADFVVKTLE